MKILLGIAIAASMLLPLVAVADVGPPAHLQITEREPGLYAVQWRVPKVLPPRAVPEPEFPETCQPVGEPTVVSQPGAWLLAREWRCETGLAGQLVGMRYPFADLALTTVMRVDLLSGDRFAHLLSPGEGPWRLPEGTAAPDLLRAARHAVLAGIAHALASWIHLSFLLVLVLLGDYRQTIRLVTAFTAGQITGVLVAGFFGSIGSVGASTAQISFALGVVILARQTLEPADRRRRLGILGALTGLVHGLGLAALLAGDLGDESTGLLPQIFAVLGMDAAHLVGACGLAALWSFLARRSAATSMRRLAVYGVGATGIALALVLAVAGGGAGTGVAASSLMVPATPAVNAGAGVARSQRVAPATPDAPVQSFLAIEPFEIRHEIMLRLAGLTDLVGLDPQSTLAVDAQDALRERLAAWVLENTSVQAEGVGLEALLRRADFMRVDPTGALPRLQPVPEAVGEAVVGVVVAYSTAGMPRTVSMAWTPFPVAMKMIPTTVIDPEAVSSRTLSAAEPALIWNNTLGEDPIPTVAAIAVEPRRLPLPWLSLPLLALAAILLVAALRGRRPVATLATARVLVALACVVGPLARSAVALPGSAGRTPSELEARRILAGLLPNIYRALEFRDEAVIYDRLAVSVTGETLRDVYLEQRRALEIEERGGAQARVDAVEVLAAGDIETRDRGFGLRATWTVGGMVTHFGHRHFRQNRYQAWFEILPVNDTWKIQSLEILEQERVR